MPLISGFGPLVGENYSRQFLVLSIAKRTIDIIRISNSGTNWTSIGKPINEG